mmetsp:Transcript_30933/g.23010  ORF Transcript_30933/g.23010 Transcript_30933/m.23010 type:complete len:190 (+) Transcript_30933:39-608(+)
MSTFNSDGSGKGSRFGDLPPLPDFSKISPVYSKRNASPDYIPYNKRGRDFYGRLSFNMGVFWLIGFGGGGMYGFVEGWRNAASPTYKVRLNSVMNAVSKRGAMLGSKLGIIAFMHTCAIELSDMAELDSRTGFSDMSNVLAGVVTGGIFFSSRGPRAASLAALLGGGVSVAYSWAGNQFDRLTSAGGRF